MPRFLSRLVLPRLLVVRYVAVGAFVVGAFVVGTVIAGLLSPPVVWGAEDELSVQNPSFEITQPNGMARDWSGDTNYFTIEYGAGRTGNAALRWENNDASVYKLCSQQVEVPPGTPVTFSVQVKTENVKGGNATICMEWSKGGKWLGGAYTNGVKGTHSEWTQVSGRCTIPEDAESISLTCYVTNGGTGVAWFDDVELGIWVPPLLSGINTDHYRHLIDGGDLTVRVGVSKSTLKADLATLTDPLVITGETLAEPIKIAPSCTGEDYLEFIVPTDSFAAGQYTATFATRHPQDGSEASLCRTFTRVEKLPKFKTYIDEHRRAIVDGQPFFPLGCYFGAVKSDELAIYADSAFNCLMPYNPPDRAMLDLCQEKNIGVIFSVKDNFPNLSVNTAEEGIERTKEMVAENKDHPAIFAWYINDELPLSMLDELTARRDLMEELDPSRPTWVVLYQIDDIRGYIPTFDVIGTDPYPIPSDAASVAASHSLRTNAATFHFQADWQVPQIFNWASYKKGEEKKGFRAPTYDEIRSMAWMAIAGGANGLVFYSWFDLWRMDKTVENGGAALVREPFEERWPQVKKMAAEIAEYFPVLLAVEKPKTVTLDAEQSENVIMRLYGHEGKTWTLLVNTATEPRTAVLNAPSDSPAETQLGGRIASQADGKITVELAPLEPSFVILP